MGLFSALVGTVIETGKLPFSMIGDALDIACGEDPHRTSKNLDLIKFEAEKADK